LFAATKFCEEIHQAGVETLKRIEWMVLVDLAFCQEALLYRMVDDDGWFRWYKWYKDPYDPIKITKAGAEYGDPESQAEYGTYLETGEGLEKNHGEAVKYFKMSADQGCGIGEWHYGRCLKHGIGIMQNVEEAAKWLKKSADQGCPDGECDFGFCHIFGEGVENDLERGVRYIKSSADGKNWVGEIEYTLFLRTGIGVEKNMEEAHRRHRSSSSWMSRFHWSWFACHPHTAQTKEILKSFKMFADEGNPEFCHFFAICLSRGGEVRQNSKGRLKYFWTDLKDGFGIRAHPDVVKYLKTAADQGYEASQYEYGSYLLKEKNDEEEGLRYLKMAADRGHERSLWKLRRKPHHCWYWCGEEEYKLGCRFQSGQEVKKDLVEAAKYFKISTEKGYFGGQYGYGMCLLKGEGVEMDLKESAKYLKLSTDQWYQEDWFMISRESIVECCDCDIGRWKCEDELSMNYD
jgi:TPR repeat protein